MSDSIIRVENLGKKYIISHQQESSGSFRYKALRDVLADGVKSVTKKLIKPSAEKKPNPVRDTTWKVFP
jgi:hypothetical protein